MIEQPSPEDRPLAVLASIPLKPKFVRFRDLAKDFGYPVVGQVHAIHADLVAAFPNLQFLTGNGPNGEGRVISIDRRSAYAAELLAESYMRRLSWE